MRTLDAAVRPIYLRSPRGRSDPLIPEPPHAHVITRHVDARRVSHRLCEGSAAASRHDRIGRRCDARADALPPGEARLAVDGGRIWYRVVGSGTATPAILLHGGPGFGSFYMKSLEALSADRPVVRYDQLGGGKSDKITDTAMFNIAHFVRELDSLRSHLGYDKVHLVGHSWGTILGPRVLPRASRARRES